MSRLSVSARLDLKRHFRAVGRPIGKPSEELGILRIGQLMSSRAIGGDRVDLLAAVAIGIEQDHRRVGRNRFTAAPAQKGQRAQADGS